jgi:hypothetical protein
MCKAGCERVWLQTALLSLARYPLHPTRIKAFPIEEKRRMERVIRKLESARVDLERFDHSVFISGWPPQSPVELEHLFAQVEDLEFGLRHVAKTANPRVMTARDRVPYLLQVIKKATGRAHYPEMATLIGAAYNEPSFDAENLKMLDHRNGQSRRQK